MLAHPEQEPLDDAEGDKEGDRDADEEDDPAFGVHDDVRGGDPGGLSCLAGVKLLQQVPTGGGDHGGNGEQEAELEG